LAKWRRTPNKHRGIRTGDFSTMYTTIPHQLLIDAVRAACTEAFEWEASTRDIDVASMRLSWTKTNGEVEVHWTKSNRASAVNADCNDSYQYTFDELISAVRFLVDNIYILY